jgi:2-hydroxychromene-2-carboxylate isomerase
MVATFEFLYDFISPYSYLASTRLAGIAQKAGIPVTYRPVFLGGIFKETGNRPPLEVAAKAAYLPKDVQDWASYYGVPIMFPASFPFSSIKALRGALVAEAEGKLAAYTRRVFDAVWAEGGDVSRPEVLAQLVEGLGLEGDKFMARIEEEQVKEELKRRTSEAVGRGVFGLPTFFVDGELFWGNDRLVLVETRFFKKK